MLRNEEIVGSGRSFVMRITRLESALGRSMHRQKPSPKGSTNAHQNKYGVPGIDKTAALFRIIPRSATLGELP
jgi:hypothetical protein